MGKPTGFLEIIRKTTEKRPVSERILDFSEVDHLISGRERDQAARCMDCGIPFCHNSCPLGNIIPEFNDAVWQNNFQLAYKILASTNNFPEFTGRICPAPCEASCVLGINNNPVSIEYIERSIIEKAFENDWVKPNTPSVRTGFKIGIVGSGPSGLAAADLLNQWGHSVAVYERADQIGGLLRYGIPDFKLDKKIIDRRLELMKSSGIEFFLNTSIGIDVSLQTLKDKHDVLLLAIGSTVPRNVDHVKGHNLKGIHFAMEFLTQQNKINATSSQKQLILTQNHKGEHLTEKINAKGKRVVVIGGGDTGSDCIGTAIRQGAISVTQLEIMPKPPEKRSKETPWPLWPNQLRVSTSHEEGCERKWSVETIGFNGDQKGQLLSLTTRNVEWKYAQAKAIFEGIEGTEQVIPCDLVLIAAGFLQPDLRTFQDFELETDTRGNIRTHNFETSKKGIFATGDARRGQSLVVWAIAEGRKAATAIHETWLGTIS